MKKNKLTMGLSLTLLIALCTGGQAYAEKADSHENANSLTHGDGNTNANGTVHTKMEDGEPVQSQNFRQRTPHSQRKAAALRLKAEYESKRDMQIVQPAEHGNGHKGGSK